MRTRTGSIVASLIGALALMLGAAACSGGGDKADGFVGTWEVIALEGEDGATEEEVAELKEMGLTITVTFAEDGEVIFDAAGEAQTGTWEKKGSNSAEVTIDGETVKANISQGKMRMGKDGQIMVLVRQDPTSQPTAEPAEDDDAEEGLVEDEVVEEVVVPDMVVVEPGVPFGDSVLEVTVGEPVLDWSDSPSYPITVKNLSDQAVTVTFDYGSFSVGGKMVDPLFYEAIQPGKYVESEVWFSTDEVPDLAALVDVEGVLSASNDDYDIVSEIPMKLPNG